MNKQPEKIKNMFDKISAGYDRMNNIISFGMDKIIKLNCLKSLDIKDNDRVLDLCTGTGDIARIIKKIYPKSRVVGVDFSEKMLEIAQKKAYGISFINADCTNLPFEDNSFDCVTICYGLRNVENRKCAIDEIYRVLKPDGKLMHLDFGEKNFAGSIFEQVVPFIANLSGADVEAYKYLVESKRDFPTPKELVKEFSRFKLKSKFDFIFKTISCQIYIK